MITIKRIRTSDENLYKFMEDLLVASFPLEEYRELSIVREYTDENKLFHNMIIFDEDTPVGLITYWDLNDFFYVEHFAIDPAQRNGGYGKQVLELISNKLTKPIVLEVELPTEEMAKRRISFYERHGFTLWENEYVQPPYREGGSNLPMFLMVSGDISQDKCPVVASEIHKKVYGVKDDK